MTPDDLAARAAALESALLAGGDQLEPTAARAAQDVLGKVAIRTSIAGDRTVVALAGATGSGKSSVFNAMVGEPVAAVGARRPTTSTPTAALWGPEPAGMLLDWLRIPTRHAVTSRSPAPGDLDGLVLLDLPDIDSRERRHREEADRVLELVDVFVWVTDPQKYADALLHDEYLTRLRGHETVMVAVLNQSDLLPPDAAEACESDLRRLLAADGLKDIDVVLTSARTGAGMARLRELLATAVAARTAMRQRLSADLTAVAGQLRAGVAEIEPALSETPDEALVEALGRAAGVPVVLSAVEADYRREAAARTGWLFSRWTRRFTADPLARLRLHRSAAVGDIEAADVRAVLGRSSIPAPTPTAQAAVSLATRRLAESASVGLPTRWSDAVHAAAAPDGATLAGQLDQSIVGTPLRARDPRWWRLLGWWQWSTGLATLVGVGWLTVLAVIGWLQLPDPEPPRAGGLPWPFLLFAGGLLGGVLLAVVARSFARVGARRRRRLIGRRLNNAVTDVAATQLVAPVREVLDRHRLTREHLDTVLDERGVEPRRSS